MDLSQEEDYIDPIIERVGCWKVMFGKHKGTTYKIMATDNIKYLRWMRQNDICNNEDVNHYIDHFI